MDMHLTAIGRVRSSIGSRAESPKMEHEGAPDAWIDIDPAFAPALDTLAEGQEIIVFTWLHLSDRGYLQVHPRGDVTRPKKGVFNTRSPDRPNPIGMHRVRILARKAHQALHVYPLEALDGTPVIDIKPVARRSGSSQEQDFVDWGPSIPWEQATAMRDLLARSVASGLLAGVHGNASIRHGHTVIMTCRGTAKGRLAPGDLTALDLESGKRLSPGRPSSEAPMHLALYDAFESVGAVLHTHPPHVLALELTVGQDGFLNLPLFEAPVWRDSICFVPELQPGSEAMAQAVAEAATQAAARQGACRAAILSRHGMVVWGETLSEAVNTTETIEALARIQLLAKDSPFSQYSASWPNTPFSA